VKGRGGRTKREDLSRNLGRCECTYCEDRVRQRGLRGGGRGGGSGVWRVPYEAASVLGCVRDSPRDWGGVAEGV
jgi:hypothetical protein